MPYPTPPKLSTSYTAIAQAQGDGSLPGQQMDVDYRELRDRAVETIEFLKGIMRSDGNLNNAIVKRENLAPDVSIGFRPPEVWEAGNTYAPPDTVFHVDAFYICTIEHTAGESFEEDAASGRWALLVNFGQIATDAANSASAAEQARDGAEKARDEAVEARDAVFATQAPTIADLISMDTSALAEGAQVSVAGYAEAGDSGGGLYIKTEEEPSFGPKVGTGPYFFMRAPTLDLRQFGVFGSDNEAALVDETTGIMEAINAAIGLKSPLHVTGAHYQMGAIEVTKAFDLAIIAPGERPVFWSTQTAADAGGDLIRFDRGTNSWDVSGISVAADILPNQKRIALNDVSGISPGMMIGITSDADWYYDARGQWKKGELHRIAKIYEATDEIEVYGATWDAYDISSETLTTRIFWPDRLTLENLSIRGLRPSTDIHTSGVSIGRVADGRYNEIDVRGFTQRQISNSRSYSATFDGVNLEDAGPSGEIGYGLSEHGAVGTTVRRLSCRGVRRSYDASTFSGSSGFGPTRLFTVDDFSVHGGGVDWAGVEYAPNGSKPNGGLGMHGPAEMGKFVNGFVENVQEGVTVRGRSISVRNVDFRGHFARACISATYGEGLEVSDCTYRRDDRPQKVLNSGLAEEVDAQAPVFIRFGNGSSDNAWKWGLPTTLKDNSIHGTQFGFAEIASAESVKNLHVRGNTVIARPDETTIWSLVFSTAGPVNLVTGSVYGNEIIQMDGAKCRQFGGDIVAGVRTEYDDVLWVGPRTFRVRMGNETARRVRNATTFFGDPIKLSVLCPTYTTVRGDFVLRPDSATLVPHGEVGTGLDATGAATSLNGTYGTSGTLRFSLTNTGELWFQNRVGATIDVTISLG